jgi:hypothetical protein
MSKEPPKLDFAKLLADAKLPEKTVPVCLRGDLVADFEAADRELEQAQKKPASSLAGSGTSALTERLEALEAEMREHTYTFRLRGMPRHVWRELMAAHPPRVGDDGELVMEDRLTGANRLTVFEPLVRASIVDPVLDDAQFADLMSKLTDRQFEDLTSAAWDLNQGSVDIPFSRAASRIRRTTSDE